MPKANLFVATPTTDSTVTTEYFQSINGLIFASYKEGSTFNVSCIRTTMYAEVAKARNVLAAKFMEDERFTHLLFVDADMGFNPSLVARMLATDHPFVGALSPYKYVDPATQHRMARRFDDPRLADRLSLDFVAAEQIFNEGDEVSPRIRVHDGFVRVHRIGTGITLLARSVFDAVQAAHPTLWSAPNSSFYAGVGIKGRVHQCFAGIQRPDGDMLSEDFSFCERWTSLGGEIWACVDEDIAHVGRRICKSAYIDRLRHNIIQTKGPR